MGGTPLTCIGLDYLLGVVVIVALVYEQFLSSFCVLAAAHVVIILAKTSFHDATLLVKFGIT